MDQVIASGLGDVQTALPLMEGPEALGENGLALNAVQGYLLILSAHWQGRIYQKVTLTIHIATTETG